MLRYASGVVVSIVLMDGLGLGLRLGLGLGLTNGIGGRYIVFRIRGVATAQAVLQHWHAGVQFPVVRRTVDVVGQAIQVAAIRIVVRGLGRESEVTGMPPEIGFQFRVGQVPAAPTIGVDVELYVVVFLIGWSRLNDLFIGLVIKNNYFSKGRGSRKE